jgi:hypothetical protein
LDSTFALAYAWLTILLVGGIWFRRRDPGRNPGFAAALQFVVPGLGYAYLHRWDRFLAAFVVVIGAGFVMYRVFGIEMRYILFFATLGYAAMIFDCMFTARRMARREEAEERSLKKRK